MFRRLLVAETNLASSFSVGITPRRSRNAHRRRSMESIGRRYEGHAVANHHRSVCLRAVCARFLGIYGANKWKLEGIHVRTVRRMLLDLCNVRMDRYLLISMSCALSMTKAEPSSSVNTAAMLFRLPESPDQTTQCDS